MKRIWFAVIFLVIAGILCVSEQYYVKNVYHDLTLKIETAQNYAEKENKEQLNNSINEIKKYWDKNNELLCTIADHGVLDDLGTEINSLNADDPEEAKNSLKTSKALTKIFYENQRTSFANILSCNLYSLNV